MDTTEIQLSGHPNEDFTEREIANALRTLALYGGNLTRASKALEADGTPVSASTLGRWRNDKFPVQYEQIVHDLRESIGSSVSDGAIEVAVKAQELANDLVEDLADKRHELKAKELPKAALNIAQVARTNVEVARLLRNEPTSIIEVRSFDETLDTLEDLDVLVIDEHDVEDVTDAEVVE